MTFVAKRMRFGRYVFSIGGNPEAASLSGIKTKAVTMQVFGLMGLLTGIAACITTARLNAATNSAGTLDELYVIAAAVIGGTSLAGGVGTIVGAMLGALIMQSLQSGMVLLGVDTPLQNIVVGIVLVMAIWSTAFIAAASAEVRERWPKPAHPSWRCARSPSPSAASRRGGGERRSLSRRGRRPAGPQRRGQIDADQDPIRAPIARTRAKSMSMDEKPRSTRRATPRRSASRRSIRRSPRRQCRRGANIFLGREKLTRWGTLDDAAMESETRKVMARLNPISAASTSRSARFGRTASIRRDRTRHPFQRARAHHGRADRRPGSCRDGAGRRIDEAAEGRGDRHLPHQPRPS